MSSQHQDEHRATQEYDPETGEIREDNAETVIEDVSGFSAEGIEVIGFIAARHCLPNMDFIREHIVKRGAGYKRDLAQIVGWCNATTRQKSMLPGEKEPSESIALHGGFKLLPLIDGLTPFESNRAFLPAVWAERAEAAVKSLDLGADPQARIEMILTIGAQATGKPGIEHRWTIKNHLIGQEDPTLERLERIAKGKPVPRRLAGPGATIGRIGPGSGKTIDVEERDDHAA